MVGILCWIRRPGFDAQYPRHPALQSHRFVSLSGPNREEAYVSYAELDTPAAYRVIWCYGPARDQITVIAITKHP